MKTRISTAFCGLISGLLLLAAGTLQTQAAVIINLSGTPGSSIINYDISGSGTFEFELYTGTRHFVLDLSDPFSTTLDDLIPPIATFGITGTLTNTTTTLSTSLVSITLDSDGPVGVGSQDDVILTFAPGLGVTVGDSYTLTGSGTFDMAGVGSFDDMNTGSWTQPISHFLSPLGGGTLNITPEPSRALLSLVGIAAIGLRRRRN